MSIFKRHRKPKATTRIVTHVKKVPETTPAHATVSKVLHVTRWKSKREAFKGFESPPGRF